MKNILCLTLCAILSMGLSSYLPTPIVGQHQLTLEEAERILGEPAVMKERSSDTKNDMYISKSTFTAKAIEEKTQKQGNVYYMVERYKTEEEAAKTIQTYIQGNQNQKGFERLTAYGDQAFFLTDTDNFCLMVIRKANKMFRIKVNKITSKTSFDAIRKIGKDLVERVQ